MSYFRSLFLTALLSGLIGGLVLGVLHLTLTGPLIIEAEQYEQADPVAGSQPAEQAEWVPAEGFERAAFTFAADLLIGVGFASLFVVAISFFTRKISIRDGGLLGVVFFLAFAVVPSLGLPPELPGTEAGPLGERQIWWLGTALATLAGLGFLWRRRRLWEILAGFVLIAAPHVVGAPILEHMVTNEPEDLLHEFQYRSLIVSGIFWVTMGISGSMIYRRLVSE